LFFREENSGFITTPNYPSDYDSNSDCLYIISPVDDKKQFKIVFDYVWFADIGDRVEV